MSERFRREVYGVMNGISSATSRIILRYVFHAATSNQKVSHLELMNRLCLKSDEVMTEVGLAVSSFLRACSENQFLSDWAGLCGIDLSDSSAEFEALHLVATFWQARVSGTGSEARLLRIAVHGAINCVRNPNHRLVLRWIVNRISRNMGISVTGIADAMDFELSTAIDLVAHALEDLGNCCSKSPNLVNWSVESGMRLDKAFAALQLLCLCATTD